METQTRTSPIDVGPAISKGQLVASASPNAPAAQPSEAQALTLRESPTDRVQLSALLSQCFDGLKLYGREPEQLEGATALFNLVLADYPFAKIEKAFRAYLSRNTEMPTPADIAALIRRNGKPPLEKSVYTALVQKRERTSFVENGRSWNCLTVDEEQYIAEYEAEAMGA